MLKKILIFVLVLIALPFVIAIFTKKDYGVEKEIIINKPNQEVFDYLKFLKNQDNFSTWSMMDPNMKKSHKGIDGTVGFISAWESEKDEVGKGEQEIKKIENGKRVDIELRFLAPFEETSNAYYTTQAISDSTTKVKWGFSSRMDYPSNLLLLAMDMEGMIGKDFETGLSNLKKILEK